MCRGAEGKDSSKWAQQAMAEWKTTMEEASQKYRERFYAVAPKQAPGNPSKFESKKAPIPAADASTAVCSAQAAPQSGLKEDVKAAEPATSATTGSKVKGSKVKLSSRKLRELPVEATGTEGAVQEDMGGTVDTKKQLEKTSKQASSAVETQLSPAGVDGAVAKTDSQLSVASVDGTVVNVRKPTLLSSGSRFHGAQASGLPLDKKPLRHVVTAQDSGLEPLKDPRVPLMSSKAAAPGVAQQGFLTPEESKRVLVEQGWLQPLQPGMLLSPASAWQGKIIPPVQDCL